MKNFLMVVFTVFIFMILAFSFKSKTSNSAEHLNAHVNFDGATFRIYNNDSFDWTEALLELNNDYSIKHQTIKSGQVFVISPYGFTKKNGKRFNVYTHKVKDIFIYAQTPHGKLSYSGESN